MINKKSQFSDPELFRAAKKVDYYDNICEYVPGTRGDPSLISSGFIGTTTSQLPDPEALIQGGSTPSSLKMETLLDSVGLGTSTTLGSDRTRGRKDVDPRYCCHCCLLVLETECRLDGIVVTAHFDAVTSGAIFIKDHSSTCRQVFEKASGARLEIPFPSNTDSNAKCPGVELAPRLWSFIVVIQKNNIGIPSLMTGTDRIFNVTCDYSNVEPAADKVYVSARLAFASMD